VVAEAPHESGGVNYPSDVYVVDIDGRHLRNLTHDHASNGWAYWTPDGKRIIFASHRSNTEQGAWHIYAINADGSARRRLTSAAGGAKPAVSPDGRRIAFVIERPPDRALYVMNADGQGKRLLTRQRDERGAIEGELGPPHWSPDGRWIVFTRSTWSGASAAPTSLYVINPDGSRLTRLEHSESLQGATWAPRGDTLLVIHDADFTIAHIRRRGDTLTLVRVRKIRSLGGYFVGWSPDARSILFNVSRRLWVADVDGRGSRRRAPVNAFSISWSTDGRWIAFARSRSSNPIEVARATGMTSGSLHEGSAASSTRSRGRSVDRARVPQADPSG
jgi:Tol biopolymer transport system component